MRIPDLDAEIERIELIERAIQIGIGLNPGWPKQHDTTYWATISTETLTKAVEVWEGVTTDNDQ